ncbi:MAG: type I-E CRISPR-associated protein Cse1/CasA [Candidatus Binatus sp.]|uniref:type I-E CRISPR-associated protein Cse1/CasA n=1 Tax=Candidatus Binatus sp. TaxID=2811406 RepID=UPI00271BE9C1|nr:type I-E CRISPR-associated protein Cse1/CasA [Candidatus Binatus sp.]MDO8434695.1 type I-E CRISPR-associated protein Cse1/CasA [Candidatus Binatus sp.]
MPDLMFNLLTDSLFSIDAGGTARFAVSLPEVLARLGGDQMTEFSALQPHQQHAWHAFLVQLAAIALHASGAEPAVRSADQWLTMLRHLTGGDDAPWSLVVADLAKPAFMQPPVPEGTLEGWAPVPFPDEIDILATARNHDVKSSRIEAPRPEHWIYALVTVQTMAGFEGRSKYGIARMNSGFGNRPCLSASSDLSAPVRFRRDLAILLEQRPRMIETYGYQQRGGAALLWTPSWDGQESGRLALEDCDPFFIEVARRVRFVADTSSRLSVFRKGTKQERVNSDERKGDLGDPWVPISRDGKAWTATDLSYRHLCRVLFTEDFLRNSAAQIRRDDGDSPVILAQVLARGQGKTDGYHERMIPVTPKIRDFFVRPDRNQQLAALARNFVQIVDDVEKKVLRLALLALIQGGPDKIDFQDRRPDGLVNELDSAIDRIFFPRLFELAGGDDAGAALDIWRKQTLDLARQTLEQAFDSIPIPLARRYRAIAMAERIFNGAARKLNPEQHTHEEEIPDGTSTS